MGVHSSTNKICSLSEAVSQIENGSIIAVGGNLSAREPMAIIREMIRQGKRDMHNIGGAHGIDVDLMCAGGVLKKVQNSYVGFEADFGLAPNYRRQVEDGRIQSQDTDCVAILTQLRAAIFGVPFMPMPLVKGTDILKANQDFRTMICPYTSEELSILPALKPDWAIIHVHKSDRKGNIRVFPPYFSDLLVVEASRNAIVSVEEIVSGEEMERIGANIPYYEVTAVVEAPFGAHPTSCYPDYSYDREHISEYMKLAKQGEATFEAEYLEKYVRTPNDPQAYIDLIGGKRYLSKLRRWNDDYDTWKQLLTASA